MKLDDLLLRIAEADTHLIGLEEKNDEEMDELQEMIRTDAAGESEKA